MSSFVLKILACVCMFCDHFGDFYFDSVTVLNYIGRFAFTIFAFQIVQGYIHTHNIKKYVLRLSVFAVISQIPYMLFNYAILKRWFEVNVIFTLLFGLLVILTYDKYNKFVGFSLCFSLGLIAQALHFDYGFYGVFIVFMFYLLHDHKLYMSIIFVISVIVHYYMRIIKYGLPFKYIFMGNKYSILMYFTCISVIPILLFNGKKGKDAKYLFYIFYPLHLLVLALLKLYLIK